MNDDKSVSHKWDRVVSIYGIALEETINPAKKIQYWNHSVHIWLKHYVYSRLVPAGEKPKSW